MNDTMTLGAPIAVHPQADPLDDLAWADRHPEIDGAWIIDHLQGWFPDGVSTPVLPEPHQLLDPLSLLAAGAAATHRVPLGVAVTDPIRRSGVALAQLASTIGWMGQRPMNLGIGVGDPGQLQPFGLHPGLERTGRLKYIRPALQTLDNLRRPQPDADTAARLGITAVTGYNLYVAAHGPRMLELTARHGDGWLPSSLAPNDYRTKLNQLRSAAESIGRDPAEIRPALFLWTALADTEEQSAALLRDPSVRAVALFRGPAGFAKHGATYPLDHGYIPHLIDPKQASTMLTAIPDEVVQDAVLHGSPDQVRNKLGAYADAGCKHVICYDIGRFVHPDGTDRFREAFLQAMRL